MMSTLKKHKPFLLLTLGATVVLAGGGATAYWLLVQRNLSLGNTPAQLVPQNALLTASISTNPEQWQQLQQYGTVETQAALNKQLSELQNNLLTANGFNYSQDIQPWVGEQATIAYMGAEDDSDQVPSTKASVIQPPDLIVLPIQDPTQALQLLNKANSQKAAPWVERTYKGIAIRETQKNNAQNYTIAVLGRFLVVTQNSQLMERVIDSYKGAASVATIPGYTDKLGKIRAADSFAQLYLNVPVFSALAAANSTRTTPNSSAETLSDQQQRQGIAATITLEPEGMQFQGITWLKPRSPLKYNVENPTSRLPRRLPANTLFMMANGSFAQSWQSYAQASEIHPLFPIPSANLAAGVQATLGLEMQEDLLPWMDGEFLLALVPASPEALTNPQNQYPQLGGGVVLMVQASDRSRAEAALKKLDTVMATRYQFQVEKTQLGAQPVVNWVSPLGGISVTHGWLDSNVVFLTFGAPIANEIVPQPPATLAQSSLFQNTVPTHPHPNNGQFFLDVERTFNQGTLNLPQLPPQLQMFAQSIRTIGVTSAISDERSTRFNMFVQLKPKLTPSTSPTAKPQTPNP